MEKKITRSAYSTLVSLLPDLADQIVRDEPLAPHTTFRVGGPAELYYKPSSAQDLIRMLGTCRAIDLPVTVLGCGSNVVIADEGIRHMVIQLCGAMKQIRLISREEVMASLAGTNIDDAMAARLEEDAIYVLAESGALLADLSAFAADESLCGLEFACGIPGSVGGAVFMNAGAYGYSMEDVIIATNYIDQDNKLRMAVGREHDYAYRHSLFSDSGSLVLSSIFQLKRGDEVLIRSLIEDFTKRRQSTQPLEYPSGGSVFKRPTGYYAGKLISDAGLRGCRIGGAEVSEKHAGFIINRGNATAEDIRALVKHIQTVVKDTFSVDLETEIRMID